MIPLRAIKNSKRLFKEAVDQITPEILGSVIDHTLLRPTAVRADIEKLCREANEISSFICVNGSRIRDAKTYIKKEKLMQVRGVAAVIGFPFGTELTKEKKAGAFAAIVDEEADEVDMVLNIGKLIEGDYGYVQHDIQAVAETMKRAQDKSGKRKILKVIQENCCLREGQKQIATSIIATVAKEIIDLHIFTKTSTGFGVSKNNKTPQGATLKDVWLMRDVAETYPKYDTSVPRIGIKTAGGIKDAETAIKMMLAGGCFDDNVKLVKNPSDIFRIGTSSGKTIVDDFKNHFMPA